MEIPLQKFAELGCLAIARLQVSCNATRVLAVPVSTEVIVSSFCFGLTMFVNEGWAINKLLLNYDIS